MENVAFATGHSTAADGGVDSMDELRQPSTDMENAAPSSARLSAVCLEQQQQQQHDFQQEVVNNNRPSSLLSPMEQHHQTRNHLSESDSSTVSPHTPPPFQRQRLSPTGTDEDSSAVAQIKALIDFHRLSREQFMRIYDEYMNEKEKQAQMSISIAHAQAQAAAMLNCASVVAGNTTTTHQPQDAAVDCDINDESSCSPHEVLSSSHVDVVDVSAATAMEEMDGTGDSEAGGDDSSMVATPATLIVDGEEDGSGGGGMDTSHVGKMQSLVRSALESFETASPVMSEIGQKRKHFTLEEELRLQPSTFAQQLLE